MCHWLVYALKELFRCRNWRAPNTCSDPGSHQYLHDRGVKAQTELLDWRFRRILYTHIDLAMAGALELNFGTKARDNWTANITTSKVRINEFIDAFFQPKNQFVSVHRTRTFAVFELKFFWIKKALYFETRKDLPASPVSIAKVRPGSSRRA